MHGFCLAVPSTTSCFKNRRIAWHKVYSRLCRRYQWKFKTTTRKVLKNAQSRCSRCGKSTWRYRISSWRFFLCGPPSASRNAELLKFQCCYTNLDYTHFNIYVTSSHSIRHCARTQCPDCIGKFRNIQWTFKQHKTVASPTVSFTEFVKAAFRMRSSEWFIFDNLLR